jgi:hypothetical protein
MARALPLVVLAASPLLLAGCAASGGLLDSALEPALGDGGGPRDAGRIQDAGAPALDAAASSTPDAAAPADAASPRDAGSPRDGGGMADAGIPGGSTLLIARYTESSAFKAIAVWNRGASTVDLTRYGLCLVSNANAYCNAKAMLSGSLAANAVRTICYGSGSSIPICDVNSNTVNVNGDDRVGLFFDSNGDGVIELGDAPIDAFGELRTPPVGMPWADKTFVRWNCVARDGASSFDVASWFDATTPVPDTSNLRLVPPCR